MQIISSLQMGSLEKLLRFIDICLFNNRKSNLLRCMMNMAHLLIYRRVLLEKIIFITLCDLINVFFPNNAYCLSDPNITETLFVERSLQ